jgi:glyoxylase-like metal-dependent hydrolase (beta-lactamase superfamily II)
MRPHNKFQAAPHVKGLRNVMVNLFFVDSVDAPSSWVLIDAGLPAAGPTILYEAERLFGRDNPPKAIILTHGHFDHIGGLPFLLRRWQSPVYAHANELPFLNEGELYPPPDPSVGGGILAGSSTLYPRSAGPLPRAVLSLPEDGAVPGLPDWRWIASPGHTPGHVSLWREGDRVLISGDAIISTRQESLLSVWSQKIEVRPPPAYFTPDWKAAYDSMRRLRDLDPFILASGHGLPLKGERWRRELDTLLRDFPRRGLPSEGRYVRETWRTPSAA